jgi:endonuclease/exonuclease/phosphatase (EEP) superfamily protein YafD
VLSAVLAVVLTAVYLIRPDSAAAITVYPPGVWIIPGLLLLIPSRHRQARRASLAFLLCWLVFAVLCVEEPRSLLRVLPTRTADLRVVTLNCAGGNMQAAEEVAVYHPDIVLLQESPRRDEVHAVARQLFGAQAGVAYQLESSVLVRGTVLGTRTQQDANRFATLARVRLASGRELTVVSLRLAPPVFRLDLWTPDNWQAQTENRQLHRKQLAGVAEWLDPAMPTILGGDCNAPAGDAALRVLRPTLHDTAAVAGRGWIDTMDNETPALRIDQVWVSRHFTPVSVTAHRTRHSDHRLVVCDLTWR